MEINSHFFKKALGSLVLLLSFWVFFPLNVLAATNYGDGNYGDGVYGGGSTPTPTSTTAPATSNSSNSTTSPGAPQCGDSVTTGSPDLFEIRTTKNTATLYFAPPSMPYSNFYIAYTRRLDIWEYAVQYNQGYSPGVLQYSINALQPNTKYFFIIKPGNGCNTGNWSNTLSAITTSGVRKGSYYKNNVTGIKQRIQALISSILPAKKTVSSSTPTPVPNPLPTSTPQVFVNIPTTAPVVTPQPTPTPKFCFLWWCF